MHRVVGHATQLTIRRLYASLPSRPLKARQYIESFYKDTHDPIWRLLTSLTTPGREELSDALQRSNVSKQELDQWNDIISRSDIEDAVAQLNKLGFPVKGQQQGGLTTPTWVILYLVGFKVRTPSHATGALLDLVYGNLECQPEGTRGSLLILTAFNLARFNLLLPLRRVIDTFLTTSHLDDPESQFNLFLQAIASTPYRSVENANNVVTILRAMEGRQLKLRSRTYEALLNDRFVTVQLTKFLQMRMIQEGFVPTTEHLEAYLKVFAKNGAIHDAQQYFEIIHATQKDESALYRANTSFLSAQEEKSSAFAFLEALSDGRSRPGVEAAIPKQLPPRFVSRPKASIYDQTAALNVAAKDLSTHTESLIRTFFDISNPTIATYTVLIHGLVLRKNYYKAEIFWSKLVKQTGFQLDNHALTAGLQALTYNKKPHVAFQMLEKFTQPSQDRTSNGKAITPVELTTISMNEYLVSLKRTARPDIVRRLFTHMSTLYNVHPNAQTLCILLQSARLAYRMDDNLTNALQSLAGKINPFRRHKVPQPHLTRDQAVDEILSALGQPNRGNLRKYVGGVWMNQTAAEHASTVFLKAVWGVDAEGAALAGEDQAAKPRGALKDVESPASAFRKSHDSDAAPSSLGLGLGPELARIGPHKFVFTPPPDILTPEGKSWYPTIIPTNSMFFNYLTLLGVTGRANEVALTLAWMRSLGVQPSQATLGVALVLWAEVSVEAPWVEKWHGREENEEYTKLVDWCRDWVGESRLPHWKTLAKWQEVIRKMRVTTGDEGGEEDEKKPKANCKVSHLSKRPR